MWLYLHLLSSNDTVHNLDIKFKNINFILIALHYSVFMWQKYTYAVKHIHNYPHDGMLM